MDLVNEDSIDLKKNLDEYNEAYSKIEDENVHFFEIDKIERKNRK